MKHNAEVTGKPPRGAAGAEGNVMTDGELTVVPVVESFGSNKTIGELRILTAALPPTPGFVFTLGFQALEMEAWPGHVPTAPYVGAYMLCEVAMQYDESYIAYLRQIGKL